MKMRVVVGGAFDSLKVSERYGQSDEIVSQIEAERKASESRTKSVLACIAVLVGGMFLFVAAGIGLYDGSFDELQNVWIVSGPVVGAVFGHYFGGAGRNNEQK
ncbi:hypothetical protein HH303_12265 [Rhodospirillaceae bacterium KN72]|uniref:Uncharacterized protein n=1 Tax=Pacificispira spongiicola TaxID=2729598 RepID=A0A7Y0E177_9PROT|nr:hypothetical protein [Pacificispira spongiicola]NMM45258.1 hypothetical protein [Pacificispira spongiicola]